MNVGRRKQFRVQKDFHALNALNRVLVILVLAAGVIGGAAALIPQFTKLSEMQQHTRRLEIEVAQLEHTLVANEREIQLLTNNREYIELKARDRLDMMQPGETIFRINTGAED